MSFFLKQRKKKDCVAPLFRQISAFIEQHQRSSAAWLSRKTEKYSRQKKIIVLTFFCAIASTYWISCVIKAFNKNETIFRISRISTPAYSLPEDKAIHMSQIITEKEYADIQKFKSHMDSLKKSDEGQVIFDSILFQRPQLMDSISIIENIYLSKQKNR